MSDECRPDGVRSKLQFMRKAGYFVATVHVDAIEAPVSFGNPPLLYTPLSVTNLATLSDSAVSPPDKVYVPGGETSDYLTTASGPEGVVPGGTAVIFVPPDDARAETPNGLIDKAMPIMGNFAFASEDCWKNDLPTQAIAASEATDRMVNGYASKLEAHPGLRIPLAAIKGQF